MAKNNDTGIFQTKEGNWGYRITLAKDGDGNKVDTTCKINPDTNEPFKTKRAAKQAREERLAELKKPTPKTTESNVTIEDIWHYYLENGALTKAKGTIQKQKSMWRTHIKRDFGKKKLIEITVSDFNNYLVKLYKVENLSYKYVEGFLKFFYLFLGTAYGKDWIDDERYHKMTKDKSTRIQMPPIDQDDADKENNVVIYSQSEIHQFAEIFKRGSCYTAFLLGFYLGVRISECFGLRWSDVDWNKGTITIRRQMLYHDSMFNLDYVKTLNSSRIIEMPPELQRYLASFQRNQRYRELETKKNGSWRNTEAIRDVTITNGNQIRYGEDFINRKENGELLSINSMKYWAKTIKEETGIDFKYHNLRKTHLTMLASMNTPVKELMLRAGHKKYETTLRYYIGTNSETKKVLINNLSQLNCRERYVRVDYGNGVIKEMPERQYDALEKGKAVMTNPKVSKPNITFIDYEETEEYEHKQE